MEIISCLHQVLDEKLKANNNVARLRPWSFLYHRSASFILLIYCVFQEYIMDTCFDVLYTGFLVVLGRFISGNTLGSSGVTADQQNRIEDTKIWNTKPKLLGKARFLASSPSFYRETYDHTAHTYIEYSHYYCWWILQYYQAPLYSVGSMD